MKFSVILASLSAAAQAATVPISAPATKPDGAPVVPKNFVGFGIESAFFTNFNNTFSENLVSALAARMGEPPVLRVGGTGGDKFRYEPHLDKPQVCREGDCSTHLGSFLLGPKYFETFEKRFHDAKFIVQAPLDNPVNKTNSLAYISEAWKSLGDGKRVEAIALGNEVEYIYEGGADEYVKAALDIEESIREKLSLSGDAAKIFEAGNTASGSVGNKDSYQVTDILGAGINKNKFVSTTAEHWYQVTEKQGQDWSDIIMQRLMINHTAITQRFKKYEPGLKASREAGVNYAITEDAAVLGGAPIEFSCGFGYTLWAVDFNLAAMARGVSRVANLAGRPNAKRQFWAPDDSGVSSGSPGPQVRAPFPAAMFVADFIGKEGASAVTEIDTKTDLVGAYAMYGQDKGELQRVAIVNMALYNGTGEGEKRELKTFGVKVGDGVKSVKVQRLHADKGIGAMGYDFGGPASNVSWAGEQWSYKLDKGDGHFVGKGTEEDTVDVKDGVASIVVPDSEAVIVLVK